MMKTSPEGIALMHHYEQCRLRAYPDPGTGGAPWTIGWGDTGPDVVPGLVITQAEADARFSNRLSREFEPAVRSALRVQVAQLEFDALVSLAYNIGVRALRDSTLMRLLNSSDKAGASDQFLRWDKAAGKSLLGLRRRRAAERAMFLGMNAQAAIAIGMQAK